MKIFELINSKTHVGIEPGVLVVSPIHNASPVGNIDYESEADEVVRFLRAIFCDMTLREIKKRIGAT